MPSPTEELSLERRLEILENQHEAQHELLFAILEVFRRHPVLQDELMKVAKEKVSLDSATLPKIPT